MIGLAAVMVLLVPVSPATPPAVSTQVDPTKLKLVVASNGDTRVGAVRPVEESACAEMPCAVKGTATDKEMDDELSVVTPAALSVHCPVVGENNPVPAELVNPKLQFVTLPFGPLIGTTEVMSVFVDESVRVPEAESPQPPDTLNNPELVELANV